MLPPALFRQFVLPTPLVPSIYPYLRPAFVKCGLIVARQTGSLELDFDSACGFAPCSEGESVRAPEEGKAGSDRAAGRAADRARGRTLLSRFAQSCCSRLLTLPCLSPHSHLLFRFCGDLCVLLSHCDHNLPCTLLLLGCSSSSPRCCPPPLVAHSFLKT